MKKEHSDALTNVAIDNVIEHLTHLRKLVYTELRLNTGNLKDMDNVVLLKNQQHFRFGGWDAAVKYRKQLVDKQAVLKRERALIDKYIGQLNNEKEKRYARRKEIRHS